MYVHITFIFMCGEPVCIHVVCTYYVPFVLINFLCMFVCVYICMGVHDLYCTHSMSVYVYVVC